MINSGKVWNVSTEEKAPILSVKRNKHPLLTPLSHPSFHSHFPWRPWSLCCLIQDYPQPVTFPFSGNGCYRTNQARVKEWNSFPKVFKRSTLLASLGSSASRFCSLLVWLQLCENAPPLRRRCIRYSQLLRFHWNLIGKILQGSPIYTASIMYLRC